MVDCSGIAKYFGFRPVLPVWPCLSNRLLKANPEFDARKRRAIVRLFSGTERLFDRDLLAEAARAASIRFDDSFRPDPLLIDLYAGCLISSDHHPSGDGEDHLTDSESSSSPSHHTLASKFIDDRILSSLNSGDEIKQIVLFSDGFDTRPYRMKWPSRTSIYDVSVGSVFNTARQKLDSVGAKIMKTLKYVHVPLNSPDVLAALCEKGFDGGVPSFWVIQGFPVIFLEDVEEILSLVGSLAVKGSFFLGELPSWLVDARTGNKIPAQNWMDKIFASHGFAVKTVDYAEVAREFQKSPPQDDHSNFLFIAEHLRFSDKQMEDWRREFMRIEDEGDEDGFDDLF